MLNKARPQSFEAALHEFENTWNGGSASQLTPLYDADVSSALDTWVVAVTRGYGWSEGLPVLPEGTRHQERGQATVDYQVGDIPLSASFRLHGLRWWLTRIELPYPSIDPTLARFQEAWHAADPKALAAFFATEGRTAREATLNQSKAQRNWDVFPQIASMKLEPDGERKFVAIMELDKGRLLTKWFFRDDGVWGLYSLELPPLPRSSSSDAQQGR